MKGDEQLNGSIKMIDNESSSFNNQNFVQTKWIDTAMNGDEDLGASIKMKDGEDFDRQDLVQTHNHLPVDLAEDKIQDSWESVMESHGHMNTRTNYEPKKSSGDGYYTLKSNNADEAADVKWEPIEPLENLAQNDTEKVSDLYPDAYQARAIMNYFGYRTTFYNQLEEDIHQEAEATMTPHYNKEAGLWMGPSLL